MKTNLQTQDLSHAQLRQRIAQLTADYESKNGAVQLTPIFSRSANAAVNWNGSLTQIEHRARYIKSTDINQTIISCYPSAPCLKELASSLGISVNSLTKRAARFAVRRNKATKQQNSAQIINANQRLEKAAKMLNAGKPVELIAERLDITPRQVRHYRQQMQQVAA